MVRPLLLFFLILSCAHEPKKPTADDIFARMTTEEKYKVLRAYRFFRVGLQNPETRQSPWGYFPGLPRLGIPSLEFVGTDSTYRKIAREEKTLKIGFVNLVRDFEKTQVFGNFDEASTVNQIMGPGKDDLRSYAASEELKDLDLFLVQEGTQGRVRKYVCAHYREKNDFHCVGARLDSMLKEMGLEKNFDELVMKEELSPEDLNRLSRQVLITLDELKLL